MRCKNYAQRGLNKIQYFHGVINPLLGGRLNHQQICKVFFQFKAAFHGHRPRTRYNLSMAFTNFETQEINCKILFAGPQHAGKSESLRSLYRTLSNDVQSGSFKLQNPNKNNEVFDFLPLSVGKVKGFDLKLHLYSYDFNSAFDFLDMSILKGVDGVVFVADSSIDAIEDNLNTLEKLQYLCLREGIDFNSLPKVFQYNKRDATTPINTQVLRKHLNPLTKPDFETIASNDHGTKEVLQSLTKQLLEQIEAI